MLKHPVWYKLYKRETVQGILFEVGKQHEDVFWSYKVVGKANRVSIIDYIGYYYFLHKYNKEYDEQYYEVNCEGLMYNITHIICRMQDLGIEPTYNPFPGYDYPVKEILNMFSEK